MKRTVIQSLSVVACSLLPFTALVPAAQAQDAVQVNGKTVKEDQLPTDLRSEIFERRNEAHHGIERALKAYGVRLALAQEKDKNVKPENVPPLEQLLPVPAPSEADLKKVYEENKNRLPPGTTYDAVKDQVKEFVTAQARQKAIETKLNELEKSGKLKVLVQAPTAPKVNLDLAGYPARGPAKASTTVVEVADYLCPHCQQTQPEVEAMMKELGNKVRFVQVPFALRPDGLSGTLARGAFCAMKQGDDAFWKYHETAFKMTSEQKLAVGEPANTAKAKEFAQKAGLDLGKWEPCLDSAEAKKLVADSNVKMEAAGVQGTPVFFLNGQRLDPHGQRLKDIVAAAVANGAKS